ncbi:hypothetical protein KA111_01935 [Candidatus Woesebacteria bacterium]|nr:hypothetical protein [Candidatus Woesebacteria bacterium]
MTDTAQPQSDFQDPNAVTTQNLGGASVSSASSVSSSSTTSDDSTQADLDENSGDLATFGEVLEEIGSVAPQSFTSAIKKSTDTLNPANPVGTFKEKQVPTSSTESASIDIAGGVQAVEVEKLPEIPVEVESFLHRVEENQDQAPDEIVIADGTVETVKASYPSTPVVVLPITEEEEKEGEKKSPIFSLRWLVEWSHKVVKLFAGKAIYRKETQ